MHEHFELIGFLPCSNGEVTGVIADSSTQYKLPFLDNSSAKLSSAHRSYPLLPAKVQLWHNSSSSV